MLRYALGTIFLILLVMVIGTIVLEEFPAIQPLFEELKMHVINLYNMSLVRYGSVTTIIIIVAIFVLVGSSKRL